MTTARRGFTMLELIVSVGIILLLASLVVVALAGVRSTAARTESAASLRRLASGYSAYSQDHRGQLMPGFMGENDGTSNTLGITARSPQGAELTADDTASYVWRIAPYLDYALGTFMTDYRTPELVTQLDKEILTNTFGPGSLTADNVFGLSRVPAYGLNSVFLGGDDTHGGDVATDRCPWSSVTGESLAAVRMSEVRNPSRVLVFAPTAYWGEVDDDPSNDLFPAPPPEFDQLVRRVALGCPELRPPMLDWDDDRTAIDPQWEIEPSTNIIRTVGDFAAGGGVPFARWDDEGQLPVARLDGSVDTTTLRDLQLDLRNWSPFETGY